MIDAQEACELGKGVAERLITNRNFRLLSEAERLHRHDEILRYRGGSSFGSVVTVQLVCTKTKQRASMEIKLTRRAARGRSTERKVSRVDVSWLASGQNIFSVSRHALRLSRPVSIFAHRETVAV